MEGKNGRTSDVEVSDIELRANGDDCNDRVTKGPWTHSTDSYTRTVPQQTFTKGPKNFHCVAGIALVVVFIVGVGLGMVIGIYAIQSGDDNAASGTSESRSLKATTTSPKSTTTAQTTTPRFSHATECTCPALSPTSPPSQPQCTPCASRNPDESTGDEHEMSPFAALSRAEINKAVTAVVQSGNASYGTQLTNNRISHVYLFLNNKTSVLEYLDKGSEFPGRYAKVHVFRGARDPPDVMEYKVGPLNQSEDKIYISQLRNDGEIHFNRRPYDKKENQMLYGVAEPHLTAIRKLLTESFDGSYYRKGIYVNFAYMPAYNESMRVSTAYLYLKMGGYTTLRILPVTFRIYHAGTDQTTWQATEFYYLSQGPYESGQDLQDEYDKNTIRKIVYPLGYIASHNHEFDLKQNTSLPNRPLSNISPPRTYEPQGPRYTIKGSRVSWMDWELEFTSDAIRGPAVYDVRFKGDRIAFEISLQDVTLVYASQSNGAGPAVLSDTIFFLGNANPPHLGLDCPERANLIQLSMYLYGRSSTRPYACVFEADGQDSFWKYRALGVKSHYLVIRAPMNLGNYEYSVEWRLHLDGHLETLTSASGFLYGAFFDSGDPLVDSDKSATPFGYRLAEYMLGPIHDHAYAFKVDVDVLGEKNSMEILHWKTGSVLSALNTQTNTSEIPGYFPFKQTRYIDYELLENEAGFVLNPLKPKYFTVVNEKEKNVWGVKRGYKIVPHSLGAENFDSHVMFGPWGHLKYNIAVTRRKESEPYATNSIYDIFQPLNAFQGVDKMLDNETVRNEDLVLWVTETFFHAPSAEDLPMTLKVHRGFTLQPYNYFDRTPTFDLRGYYENSRLDPYPTDPCYISNP